MSEARGRALVHIRSGGFCEAAIGGVCTGQAESVHHRRKRSQGGDWSPANLVHVCGSGTTGCHGWIEAHPWVARETGLALYAGETHSKAVRLSFRGIEAWWRLEPDGTITWLYDR